MVVPTRWTCFVIVQSLKKKKIIFHFGWRKATQRTFLHIQGGLWAFAWSGLNCSGFSIQLITTKNPTSASDKTATTNHLACLLLAFFY